MPVYEPYSYARNMPAALSSPPQNSTRVIICEHPISRGWEQSGSSTRSISDIVRTQAHVRIGAAYPGGPRGLIALRDIAPGEAILIVPPALQIFFQECLVSLRDHQFNVFYDVCVVYVKYRALCCL